MRIGKQLVVAALALCPVVVCADNVPKPGITPVEAQLMADLRAHQMTVGEAVYARVDTEWASGECALRQGAILQGEVVAVTAHSRTDVNSVLTLAFTKAQCNGPKMGDFKLLLSAVAAPPSGMDSAFLSDMLPMRTGANGGIDGTQMMTQGTAGVIHPLKAGMNGIIDTEDIPPRLPPMKMGEVVGIPGVKLSLGTGLDHNTVLTAMKHDLTLVSHTIFLLVPAERVLRDVTPGQPAAGGATGASDLNGASLATGPAPPPANDLDTCEPPECGVALPQGDASPGSAAPDSISLEQLGYGARAQRVMTGFDHDDELAYLGPQELLVGFNRHHLLVRHELGSGGVTVRVIRAAVVDMSTRRVTHTVDWELPDAGQYLWRLPDSRVLVHVGSELRVYGAGLKIQKRLGLSGPLDFVRVTPDGSSIVVGVIHERHSVELHAQLRENLGAEPEEDVNILVLNRNFDTIGSTKTRSGMMPPTLINEGQVRLLAQPDLHYRMLMRGWDNHSATFARFESSCTPDLESIAPDMIFMVSCGKENDQFEYRVLHADGKLALKNLPNWSEFGFTAEGSADRQVFAIKSVQSTRPVPAGAPFSAADFTSEGLAVYRAADGKRLLSVTVGSPTSSRDGFALAPDGSQLAVLNRDQIQVYTVPKK